MVPQRSGFAHDPLLKGAGVCLPNDVARRLQQHASELYLPNLPFANQDRSVGANGQPPSHAECPPGRRYAEISTFAWYSPLAYAPEAVVFAVARPLGASVDTLSYLGRLAQLATYLGLVFFAIRRSSRARWALAAGAAPRRAVPGEFPLTRRRHHRPVDPRAVVGVARARPAARAAPTGGARRGRGAVVAPRAGEAHLRRDGAGLSRPAPVA